MAELDDYAELLTRRDRLYEGLAVLTAELVALEPTVLAALRQAPEQRQQVGAFILSRTVGVSVSLTNPDAAPTVFRENGLGHMVKTVESIHPSTLRAWVNRWYLQQPDPPAAVMEQVRITETETVKAKRAT